MMDVVLSKGRGGNETGSRPKPFSYTNGVLRRHTVRPPLYLECLRNHAASLGGHALDGCGEFMPSPLSSPSDPSSLKCAACGCHRNFHRRFDDAAAVVDSPKRRNSESPSPLAASAPHMLLALSTGAREEIGIGTPDDGGPNSGSRKRFRTKFSKEQKDKMKELAERLGWRLQRQDEGSVDELCEEIGVKKGVFKVWMHNNKNNFLKQDREINANATIREVIDIALNTNIGTENNSSNIDNKNNISIINTSTTTTASIAV